MYEKEYAIPAGVSVEVSGRIVKVSGSKGTLERIFKIPKEVDMEKKENKIRVFTKSEVRKNRAVVGTVIAHIKNMARGVTEGFIYKMKVVYSHFPITVKVEGDKFLVQNFLGERVPRVAKILPGVQVKIEGGADIVITGIDLEAVSQTAARIELATRRTGYDKKIFQDGIWITLKPK